MSQETKNSSVGAILGGVQGLPNFVAQFDINVKLYLQTVGMSSSKLAYLTPIEKTLTYPYQIFGYSDMMGGQTNFRSNFPEIKKRPKQFEYVQSVGNDNLLSGPVYFENIPNIKTGDIVFVYEYDGQANLYCVVSCQQVAYSSLLDAIESDRFNISGIRLSSPRPELAFQPNIELTTQTLFGQKSNSPVSPIAFLRPEQFQKGTVDIPLTCEINKEFGIMSQIAVGCSEINYSIFVKSTKKVN